MLMILTFVAFASKGLKSILRSVSSGTFRYFLLEILWFQSVLGFQHLQLLYLLDRSTIV